MIRRLLTLMALGVAGSTLAAGSDLMTRPERTGYTETSLYAEVLDFVAAAAASSDKIRAGELGRSAGGRSIPLVVVSEGGIASPEEARLYGLPVVLIHGNIHAGEVEGKEALLMLLRDVVEGKLDEQLGNQVLLLVPVFNPDGNDRLGDNRRDHGPELAGIRYNDQNLDLNRDFLKLDTPEVNALLRLIRRWEPVLYVDMHTTNGSCHQEPVTYTTMANENSSEVLKAYMWQHFFPEVSTTLRARYGFDSVPYGNFEDRADPSKGWSNHAFEARYSTNCVGLRNIFTVLDENYSHADFKTRVLSSHAFIRSILDYTHEHIGEMQHILRSEAVRTREGFRDRGWVTAYEVAKLQDITIKSYEFEVEQIPEDELDDYPPWLDGVLVEKTDRLKDYTVPYFNRTIPTATVELPEAYLIPAAHTQALANLSAHGILMEQLLEPIQATVESFRVEGIEPAKRPNQGRIPIDIAGSWISEEATLEAGAYLVPLRQPLARLIPALLEPEAADSLARWGFFTSWIVPQWSREFNPYPVLRVPRVPEGAVSRLR